MTQSPLTNPDVWNDLHQHYETSLVPRFSLAARRGLDLVAPHADAEVLDIGAGPGTLTLLVAPRVRHVIAIDFAANMLKLLDRERDLRGLNNIETRLADGAALPFERAQFDAVFSCFALFLFADRALGFREMHRVLRPSGKAMISSWAPSDGPVEVMYRIVREVLPALPFQKGHAPLGTPSEIVDEMSAAGFQDIAVEGVAVPFDATTADAFWAENSKASAPLVAARKHVGEQDWPAIEQRIVSALRGALPGPVHFHRTAWVAVGQKHLQA
jgi:ubiquinone/menaquinone biosynthesis C-methylase UbiE